jgi:hypothetical protein
MTSSRADADGPTASTALIAHQPISTTAKRRLQKPDLTPLIGATGQFKGLFSPIRGCLEGLM